MTSRLMASYVFIMLIIAHIVTGFDTRDAEIEQLLKKLNKPALKSIKSPDGDIIDCVDINKQPSLDHPLLRNHTIKMKPSSYPDRWNNISSSSEEQSSLVTQLWTINGKCPKNTIPIRRTRKEDILRAKSIKRFGKKDPYIIPQARGNETHEHAVASVDGRFHGSKANINVWKPYLQKREEFSLSQIWIIAGVDTINANTIEVGWQTYPRIYGDFNPRFFIYWTADNYRRTGCYNLLCRGFVQISRHIVPGAVINPTSIYNGEQQQLAVFIWKDRASGDWWLEVNNQRVGYWPRSLFTLLADAATHLQWGGEIVDLHTGGQHTTTHMGSGRFPEEGFRKASYFKNIEIVDQNNIRREPMLREHRSKLGCYSILSHRDRLWGSYFFYGGPGRNPNCP